MTGHALQPPRSLTAAPRLLGLRARVRAATLDRHLAAGVSPTRTPLHEARARQLTDRHRRDELAATVRRLVDDASPDGGAGPGSTHRRRGWLHPTPARAAVLGCESQLADLALLLGGERPVDAHGVAALRALLCDHAGPLYDPRRTGELARALHRVARAIDAEPARR